MDDTTIQSTFFHRPGPRNTSRTLEFARKRAEELNIRTILVASTRGDTGAQAAQQFSEYNVVIVTHATGFGGPNTQELTDENRTTIEAAGAKFAADTCCVVAPIKGRFNALATDSAKACYYAYSKNKFKTRLLPFDEVVAEALKY